MTSPTTNTVTDELAEALKEALSWIEELYRSPMLHSISTEELRARPPRRITPIDDALAHYAALSTHHHTGTEDRATARDKALEDAAKQADFEQHAWRDILASDDCDNAELAQHKMICAWRIAQRIRDLKQMEVSHVEP